MRIIDMELGISLEKLKAENRTAHNFKRLRFWQSRGFPEAVLVFED